MKYAAYCPCRPVFERGAALVLALLIMSLVAALSVYLANSFDLSERRAGNRLAGGQNLFYMKSAEVIASHFLGEDQDWQIDHLAEPWNTPLNFSPEGYEQSTNLFSGWLEDAQGRFNLNSLDGKANGNAANGRAKDFTEPQRRFIRLLQTFEDLPLTEDEAIQLTEAVIDWVDLDDTPTGLGGAESLFYSDLGYSPSNGPMFSVSELMQVRHMTPELFALLRPLCVVLPQQSATLNINTALPQLMRTTNLISVLTPLDESAAMELIDQRGGEGYQSIQDMQQTPLMLSLEGNGDTIDIDSLAVNSNYFLLHSEVNLNNRLLRMESLIRRDNTDVGVVWRSWGGL